MLVNDVSLRALAPGELAKGFGFFQSKPSSAFSPVAVTPDELGDAWDGGKLSLPLNVDFNGKPFGRANAGVDMTFDFPKLIAHAARTRPLAAGTIIGSGTVSNKLDGGPGKPVADGGAGYSCIVEMRTIETLLHGAPKTPSCRFGDTVRIEMKDKAGHSIFGAIEQNGRADGAPAWTGRGLRLVGVWAIAMLAIFIRRSGSATGSRRARRLRNRSGVPRKAMMPAACPTGTSRGMRKRSAAAPHELLLLAVSRLRLLAVALVG